MSKQNQEDPERVEAAKKLIEEYWRKTGSFNIPFTVITKTDSLIRAARHYGLKPEYEWRQEDFQDLLDAHPELRELATAELRALFLRWADKISDVEYCQRLNVGDVQYLRNHGCWPCFPLAIPEKLLLMKKRVDKLPDHLRTKEEQEALEWVHDEKTKLARIWQHLDKGDGDVD